jgi:predicted ArsR family transcriptional regulator
MDDDADDLDGARDEVAAVSVLAEPSRRALYEYVVAEHDWVSREQAADAVGVQRGVAAHHLDRLARAGLLDVDHRRLSGRNGPGAGRPSKVYRRAAAEIGVSLPPRQYELAARLLAAAADRARASGRPIERELTHAASAEGKQLGRASRERLGRRTSVREVRSQFMHELLALGFEPAQLDRDTIALRNCPFHQLAQTHTEMICGMNLCLLKGMLGELDGVALRAALEPEDDYCCVRFHESKTNKS